MKYAVKCMQHTNKTVDKAGLPSSKCRCLILKQERVVTQGAQEALEGVSYQSGIGFEKDVDVEQLPEAVPHGNFKSVSSSCLQGEPTFITVDLETTDLIRAGQMPHINSYLPWNLLQVPPLISM